MKRLICIALTVLMLATLLCGTALAADGPASSGIYNVVVEDSYESTVTIAPQTAAATDETISATTATIDSTNYDDFYADAAKVKVTFSNATVSNFYLVLALTEQATPTQSNIVYIDQDSASGTNVSFTVYPSKLSGGDTYYIYLSSSGSDLAELVKVASFQYFAPYTLGDVDDNGTIDVDDAVQILKYTVDLESAVTTNFDAADVNKTGGVDVDDAVLILKYTVDLVDSNFQPKA